MIAGPSSFIIFFFCEPLCFIILEIPYVIVLSTTYFNVIRVANNNYYYYLNFKRINFGPVVILP